VRRLAEAGVLHVEPQQGVRLARGIFTSQRGQVARVVWPKLPEVVLDPTGCPFSRDTPVHPVKQNAPAGISDEGAQSANDCEGVAAVNIISEAEHRAAVIDGLRLLATFLELHPDVPVGHVPVTLHYSASARAATDMDARAEVDRIARLLDVVTETSEHGHYTATRHFGLASYQAQALPEAEKHRTSAVFSYYDNVAPGGAA
jgi:hypothetical protein